MQFPSSVTSQRERLGVERSLRFLHAIGKKCRLFDLGIHLCLTSEKVEDLINRSECTVTKKDVKVLRNVISVTRKRTFLNQVTGVADGVGKFAET